MKPRISFTPNTRLRQLGRDINNLERAPIKAEVVLVQKATKKKKKPIGATHEILAATEMMLSGIMYRPGASYTNGVVYGYNGTGFDKIGEFNAEFPSGNFAFKGDEVLSGDIFQVDDDGLNEVGSRGDYIFVSLDGGITFTLNDQSGVMASSGLGPCRIAEDGTYWMHETDLWRSRDQGVSWTSMVTTGTGSGFAIKKDGSAIAYIGSVPPYNNPRDIQSSVSLDGDSFVVTAIESNALADINATCKAAWFGNRIIANYIFTEGVYPSYTTRLKSAYSDDNGVTWTVFEVLSTVFPADGMDINTALPIPCGDSGIGFLIPSWGTNPGAPNDQGYIWRGDGASWPDVLANPIAGSSDFWIPLSAAYLDSTDELFILYENFSDGNTHIWKLSDASIVNPGDEVWTEITNPLPYPEQALCLATSNQCFNNL